MLACRTLPQHAQQGSTQPLPVASKEGPFPFWIYWGLSTLITQYPHYPVASKPSWYWQPGGRPAPCCPQMGIRLPFTKATRDPGHPIGIRLRGLESESGRCLVGLASLGASKGQLDHLCIHLVPRGATAQASPR